MAVQQRFNAASVLREGQVVATYRKRELPNYQVFDERRYFMPGHNSVRVRGREEAGARVKVGLLICGTPGSRSARTGDPGWRASCWR